MGKIKGQNKKNLDLIVLMAGEGRRMRPLTIDRPKSLLRCDDGISIFGHIVKAFSTLNVRLHVIPVIGHGADKVHEEVKKLNLENNCIYNPFYNTAGPLISLWLGLLQSKSENVVVVNGDTIVDESLTKQLGLWFDEKQTIENLVAGLCTSKTNELENDDMKVLLDNQHNFIEVGKHIHHNDTSVKSAGVFCVKGADSKKVLLKKMDRLLMDNKTTLKKYHWHNILNVIKSDFQVDLIEVKLNSWSEMDTPSELEIINAQ
ncbi:NTP transferase domain-containing protein [Proteinivorax tanatarense]|uniref:NTP transferase domain-containing protein n=1 Tax=Proteinivorax tanatarense TaxID=1260629 RepID=A0AAU7VHZ6_9FIRM